MAYQPPPTRSNKAVSIVEGLIKYIDENQSTYKVYETATATATKATQKIHSLSPSVTIVRESKIINNNIDDVWNVIKPCTFKFLSRIQSSELSPRGQSPFIVGADRILNYNDGTKQSIKILEISEIKKSVVYELYNSDPSITYTSRTNEIRLCAVTTSNQTFIEWRTDFSNDASLQVIEDNRYKKKDAFIDLQKYLSGSLVTVDDDDDEKKTDGGVGTKLLSVAIEKEVDVEIGKLWKVIEDFGNLEWNKEAEKCVALNDNVREITVRNNGGVIQEKLDFLKEDERSLGYSIVKNTALPVINYKAKMKLDAVANNDKKCQFHFSAKFNAKEVADSFAQKTMEEILQTLFQSMVNYAKQK